MKLKLSSTSRTIAMQLKAGDQIDIGGNSLVTITKKNAKSLETGSGCKWTAVEIIGKKAASLLNTNI